MKANNFIMKTISITLRDDGTVYRDHDDKHIATVTNGEIDWKHHAFKNKHSAEVESLLDGDGQPNPPEIVSIKPDGSEMVVKVPASMLSDELKKDVADNILAKDGEDNTGVPKSLQVGGFEVPTSPPFPEPVTTRSGDRPTTPANLFVNGEAGGEKAGWYGEENPPVVEWRRKHWSPAAFKAHYGHKTEVLTEIYEQEGLEYNA